MDDREKTAGNLYNRIGELNEKAQIKLGAPFAFRNFGTLIQPLMDSVERAVREHLDHPDIQLGQLANAVGVEEVIRLDPNVYAEIERQIKEAEKEVERLAISKG